ncbi:M43 family zinc metalloprotease, partial [Flavobacterium sp. LMO9]
MKKKLFLLTLMLYGFFAFGQNKQPSVSQSTGDFSASVSRARTFAPNGIVRCASTEYTKSKQARRTVPSDDVFEAWLAPKIAEIQRLRQLGRLPSVIKIPVVVHVIHNGDAVGSGENILDGQVLSQITVFNQDYRKLTGTPGFGAGVDTTIEFCMAQVDPSGNPTNGIDRRNLGIASFNSAAVETAKANTIWDPTKYLNMWTFRFTGDLNGVLGYAQFPTGSGLDGMPTEDCITGEASTDGVVCSFNTWGSRTIFPTGSYGGTQYDKGRTMTHEVGHMFGLRHTWGDGDCTVDDFCADTPNCSADYYAGAGTGGCIAPTQCGVTRQIQNYMDYSDDGCMNIFTQDQKDRMLAVLMNSPRRDDLLVSTVCTSSSPYIQFKRPVCEQRPVKSVIEGNGCSYTEFTVPLSIDKAPSANAVVTFMVDGTSVANASDIQIMTPSVTFNAGSTAEQNLVFRVLNDVYVETDEELVLTFTVNANGGNALANPNGGSLFNLKIMNDDTALAAVLPGQQIFYDGFETYPDFTIGNVGGWTMLDNDGKSTYVDDTYNFPNEGYTGTFIVFNPSQTTPSAAGSGYDAHSGSKGYYCYNAETPAPALNSDYIFTPQISLGTNSQLKFWAKSLTNNYNGGERFKVLVSTTNTNPASFTLISTFPYTIPPLT